MLFKRSVNLFFAFALISLLFTSCQNDDISDQFTEVIDNNEFDLQYEKDNESIDNPEKNTTESGDIIESGEQQEIEKSEDEYQYEVMEIHYIDVGEGDCTLIQCGADSMLIDAGVPDQGTAIRLYLKKHNIDILKYMILTHSDKDHIGGAASIISNVKVDNLFMCRYEKDNEVYQNLINEINFSGLTWTTPDVGSVYELGDATIEIIAPNREYDNPNDSSIGIIVKHGNNTFLFSGDAESAAEEDIVNNGISIDVDVYKVGHHGSRTSTSEIFLEKITPQYAIISCALENKYGHPHEEVLERLKAINVNLFRTDLQGTIIAFSDGNEISFNQDPTDNWEPGSNIDGESASSQVTHELLEIREEPGNDSYLERSFIDEEYKESTYIINTNMKRFHYPDCDSVKDIKDTNRLEINASREELIEQGYIPCGRCNP